MKFITIPRVNVNDETVSLSWRAEAGQRVTKDQVIGHIETTKSLSDLFPDIDGFFYPVLPGSESVKVGTLVGVVNESVLSAESLAARIKEYESSQIITKESIKSGCRKSTLKARLLADAHNISVESIPSASELIQESDVRSFLESRKKDSGEVAREIAPPKTCLINTKCRLIIVGGGMGAHQILDVVSRVPEVTPVGILDDNKEKHGTMILGVPIIDTISSAERLFKEGLFDHALCLMPNNREVWISTFQRLRKAGIPFLNLVDPSTLIESHASLGQGNIILAGSRIGSASQLGDNNFLSGGVRIDHHNIIGSHCTFGPVVVTSGVVTIGNNVKFGTGVFIEPRVEIGSNCIIASGAIITASVPDEHAAKVKSSTVIVRRKTS